MIGRINSNIGSKTFDIHFGLGLLRSHQTQKENNVISKTAVGEEIQAPPARPRSCGQTDRGRGWKPVANWGGTASEEAEEGGSIRVRRLSIQEIRSKPFMIFLTSLSIGGGRSGLTLWASLQEANGPWHTMGLALEW